MSSLKEVKRRINSVKGTMKVTSAMGSISAAKLHKTQSTTEHLLPYQEEMHRIVDILLNCSKTISGVPYSTHRPVHRVAVVLVTSNKTFCGAFNSNAVKLLVDCVAEYERQGLKKEDILVFAVGDKGADAAKKAGYNVQGKFTKLADKHEYNDTASFTRELIRLFSSGQVDKVEIIYNHFKSSMVQVPTRETYLPFQLQTGQTEEDPADPFDDDLVEDLTAEQEIEEEDESDESNDSEEGHSANYLYDDYIIEPSGSTILANMLPKVLVLKIYTVLLDAATAEHAARTIVMQQASDNGEKLLQDLNLLYNKQRQQAITNELLDIASGSAN